MRDSRGPALALWATPPFQSSVPKRDDLEHVAVVVRVGDTEQPVEEVVDAGSRLGVDAVQFVRQRGQVGPQIRSWRMYLEATKGLMCDRSRTNLVSALSSLASCSLACAML